MGSDFAKSVIDKSKVLKEKNKFSPLETAAIIAGSNSPDVLLDHLITAGNNKHGSSPFASRRQVLKARNEKLVISKDDWEASYENLYKNDSKVFVVGQQEIGLVQLQTLRNKFLLDCPLTICEVFAS